MSRGDEQDQLSMGSPRSGCWALAFVRLSRKMYGGLDLKTSRDTLHSQGTIASISMLSVLRISKSPVVGCRKRYSRRGEIVLVV